MPDDPIIDPPNPPAATGKSHTPLTCEFCGCTVSRHTGQMVSRSARATAMMNQDTEIAKHKQRIADLETALTSAQSDLAEMRERLSAAPVPKRWSGQLDEGVQ